MARIVAPLALYRREAPELGFSGYRRLLHRNLILQAVSLQSMMFPGMCEVEHAGTLNEINGLAANITEFYFYDVLPVQLIRPPSSRSLANGCTAS
ncbi:hypothetical protein [Methylobacterium sp. 17Sr1-1]|uniref:hypothetical protein n=1 Tax=Methylobacterium sp. 17Sr1-1 TaxID=2202826 RepID=UPI0013A5467E|nr:hypothetical protein [Methylobacterium sp. 17Sr1-1]